MKNNNLFIQVVLMMSLIPSGSFSQQIIADHTVVDKYGDIPQYYLDEVKKMWLNVPGESHSSGYRIGAQLLENQNPLYSVVITESGNPEPYREDALRISAARRGQFLNWEYATGESIWYTNQGGIDQLKFHLDYSNTNNLEIAAIGFGWCWDMTWHNSSGGGIDPVYQVRWAGSSVGGLQGDLRWGLDANDSVLTGNSVCMDRYLNATTEYINHCTNNSYLTKVFFTTGPVDGGGNTGERGYQRNLKHEYIRNYVLASSDRILFDYADILCWSNAGVQNTTTWTDYGSTLQTFQYIHSDNMLDLDGTYIEDGVHIGERGSVRLAKALWWLLARMAGWDGISTEIKQTDNNSASIRIYPNPVKDKITIQTNQTGKECYLTLSNIIGQELIKQQIKDYKTELDINNLTKGIYFVKLVCDKTVEVRKIIKE